MGLIWSYLRITACARWGIKSYIVKSPLQFSGTFVGVLSGRLACVSWGIMNHIVKLPHCKRMLTFSDTFCNGLNVVFKNNGLCKMGNNEQYSIKSLIANFWHFCSGLIVVFKKFSLYCLMGDNELYSTCRCLRLKMKATIFVTFCRCLVWSFYEKQPVQDQG